jgi:MoaD family protein
LRVRVKLVSLLRDAVDGAGEVVVEVDGDKAQLRDVLEKLYTSYPKLKKLIEGLGERGLGVVYMVNGQGVDLDAEVKDGDLVAILPPASGGAVLE